MREFKISVEINASRQQVWKTLVDFDSYANWNPLFLVNKRDFGPGGFLDLVALRKKSTSKVRVVSIKVDEQMVLSRHLLHASLIHMDHYFELVEGNKCNTIFTQRWQTSGLLVPLMWGRLSRAMAKFQRLNTALKQHVEK
jgi:hypothetical protein